MVLYSAILVKKGEIMPQKKRDERDVLYSPTQPNVKQVKDAQFVVVESDPPKLMVRIRDAMFEVTGLEKA